MKNCSPFFSYVNYSILTVCMVFSFGFQVVFGQVKKTGAKTHVNQNIKKNILLSSVIKLKDLPIGKTSQMRLQKALETTYYIYSFWPDSLRRDYWNGIMVMPDPTDIDSHQKLVEFDKAYFDKEGNLKLEKKSKSVPGIASFSAYQSADKSSVSQFINNGERNIGLLQAITGNKINIIIDLNSDKIIDFQLTLNPSDKKVNVFLSNNIGALRFFDDLMSYRNIFCAGNMSSGENIYQQNSDPTISLLGLGANSKSVINLCGNGSSGAGGSGHHRNNAKPYDPIVDFCKQYLSRQRNSSKINADPPAGNSSIIEKDPKHGDGDNGLGDLLRTGVAQTRADLRSAASLALDYNNETGSGEIAPYLYGASVPFSVMGQFLTLVDAVGAIIDYCDEPSAGGSDGSFSPQGESNRFLESYCQSKTGNHPGPPTIEEMEKSLKAKECPNPAESATGNSTGINQNTPEGGSGDSKSVIPPTLGDPTGKNCFKPKHYETFADLMEGVSKRRCKPNEKPDENGNCGSSSIGRTFDTERGKASITYGGIIGIHFCDPRICDPAKFRNQQLLPNKPKKAN